MVEDIDRKEQNLACALGILCGFLIFMMVGLAIVLV